MTDISRNRELLAPQEYRDAEIGLFVAQMDDQSRRLTEDTRGIEIAELEWQPQPGINTIGMLLAHIAIVEVFWIAILGGFDAEYQRVLGIGEDDDGIPLAANARPPATLRGKDIAFFDGLLARARAHTKLRASNWTAADMTRRVQRTRKDGVWTYNGRWILYHILEHEAGHYGQVNLLRHQYRTATVEAQERNAR